MSDREMITAIDQKRVSDAVWTASKSWQTAFNAGSAEDAAAHYELDALMVAKPFGEFRGREAITAFWADLIQKGLSDIEYINPKLIVLNPTAARLEAHWRMNDANGIITNEFWVLHSDGIALLREDHFEAI